MVAMSARDALFNDIWDMRSATEKNALIDAFAHELAEKQRAAAKAEFERDVYIDELSMRFMSTVIDSIDPAVKDAPR